MTLENQSQSLINNELTECVGSKKFQIISVNSRLEILLFTKCLACYLASKEILVFWETRNIFFLVESFHAYSRFIGLIL